MGALGVSIPDVATGGAVVESHVVCDVRYVSAHDYNVVDEVRVQHADENYVFDGVASQRYDTVSLFECDEWRGVYE